MTDILPMQMAIIPPVAEWPVPLRYNVVTTLGHAHMFGKVTYSPAAAEIHPFKTNSGEVTEEQALALTEALNGQYWQDLNPRQWAGAYPMAERARLIRFYDAIQQAKERAAMPRPGIKDKVGAMFKRGKAKRKG